MGVINLLGLLELLRLRVCVVFRVVCRCVRNRTKTSCCKRNPVFCPLKYRTKASFGRFCGCFDAFRCCFEVILACFEAFLWLSVSVMQSLVLFFVCVGVLCSWWCLC